MKKDNFVLIITDYGSYNNFLAEIAIKLCSSYSVHVICSDDKIIVTNDKFDYSNFDISFHFIDIPRSFSISKLLKTSFKIRKLILFIKPKLVHAHFTTGILPTILFRFWNIKYIGTFHGLGMNSTTGINRLMFFLIEHFCFNQLDKIILINDFDYKMIKKNHKTKTIKLNSQGLGCDINQFDKNIFSLRNIIDEKVKLGLDNKFVITYVGRFVEFKGFDIVVKVFNNLIKIFPNQISLLLIGGFDPIHETGLTNNETFINCDGIIKIGFSSEIPKYLSISDIFFFPSKKEGLPVCVIESLSMGVPVLAFKERGITDLIENQYNGVLIDSISKEMDILEFSKIITNFVLNKDMIKRMSINAMSNREIYSRSHFVDKQFNFYLNILNS